MSWPIAGLWAVTIGVLLLACGTAGQAWAELTEFRDLWPSVLPAARQALRDQLSVPILLDTLVEGVGALGADPALMGLKLWRQVGRALVEIPRRMTEIRRAGGEEAERIAKLARMTVIWTILTCGSLFALAGAVIQLALAYVRG